MQQVLTEMKSPHHIAFNSLEPVDMELKVFSCSAEDMPEWIKEQFLEETHYDSIRQLTFFYRPEADVVVLNRSHKNADFYELLVTTYLETNPERRLELKRRIPADSIRTALDLMDYIIKERGKYGRNQMRDPGDAH